MLPNRFPFANILRGKQLRKPAGRQRHPTEARTDVFGEAFPQMASTDVKPRLPVPPAAPAAPANESHRTKSIATRLTEAEFAEVESAAADAGKKVAEWLRDAALAQSRTAPKAKTDPILLAELMGLRALMLNLFREGSKGPISDESLRKMSAYSESIKKQKADEFFEELRAKSRADSPENEP